MGAYSHFNHPSGYGSPSRLNPWLTPDRSVHCGAESVLLRLICYMVPCCAPHSRRLLLMSQRCALSPLPLLPSLRRKIAPSGPCRVLQRGHNRPETSVCLTVGRVWRKSGTRLWASHWFTFKSDTKAWMPLHNGMFMQVESHRVANSAFQTFLCMCISARGKKSDTACKVKCKKTPTSY